MKTNNKTKELIKALKEHTPYDNNPGIILNSLKLIIEELEERDSSVKDIIQNHIDELNDDQQSFNGLRESVQEFVKSGFRSVTF